MQSFGALVDHHVRANGSVCMTSYIKATKILYQNNQVVVFCYFTFFQLSKVSSTLMIKNLNEALRIQTRKCCPVDILQLSVFVDDQIVIAKDEQNSISQHL